MRALFPSAVVWSAMVWYAMLGKGANEKPTKLHQHDARGGIVFRTPAVREAAPDIALGQKVGTAQGV
jgi:hypothetical protein